MANHPRRNDTLTAEPPPATTRAARASSTGHDEAQVQLYQWEVAVPGGGTIALLVDARGIRQLLLDADRTPRPHALDGSAAPDGVRSAAEAAIEQLRQYLCGRRRLFEGLRLAPGGTAFQQATWAAMRSIPWGATRSYGQLAAELGRPGAARAVGAACAANPIPIFIPCHRIIAADGRLGGFSGGLELKKRLLRIEGIVIDG